MASGFFPRALTLGVASLGPPLLPAASSPDILGQEDPPMKPRDFGLCCQAGSESHHICCLEPGLLRPLCQSQGRPPAAHPHPWALPTWGAEAVAPQTPGHSPPGIWGATSQCCELPQSRGEGLLDSTSPPSGALPTPPSSAFISRRGQGHPRTDLPCGEALACLWSFYSHKPTLHFSCESTLITKLNNEKEILK